MTSCTENKSIIVFHETYHVFSTFGCELVSWKLVNRTIDGMKFPTGVNYPYDLLFIAKFYIC